MRCLNCHEPRQFYLLNNTIRNPIYTFTGVGNSNEHLVFTQPGIANKLGGCFTNAHTWAANLMEDHLSGLIFSRLMCSTTIMDTLVDKAAYDQVSEANNVNVESYHAKTGRYAEQGFRYACNLANHSSALFGVGAPRQNTIAKDLAKELTLASQTILDHAKFHWPNTITMMLWAYALKRHSTIINISILSICKGTNAALHFLWLFPCDQ